MQHSRLEYSTPSGRVLALHVRSTNKTTRTSPPCFCLSHCSLHLLYRLLYSQEAGDCHFRRDGSLSCQGVIFLGAYNWLIPKKALSSIKTSSVLLRKHMLWFLKCVIDLNYQLLIWKRNFILHSYEERHQGKFLQLPFPLVMHILRTLE